MLDAQDAVEAADIQLRAAVLRRQMQAEDLVREIERRHGDIFKFINLTPDKQRDTLEAVFAIAVYWLTKELLVDGIKTAEDRLKVMKIVADTYKTLTRLPPAEAFLPLDQLPRTTNIIPRKSA